jgi:hypothetical protein
MGRWLKKFSERAQVSADNVDTLYTASTLSASNHRHSQDFSVPANLAETAANTRSSEVSQDASCTSDGVDSVDTVGDAFSESPSVNADSVDALYTTSTSSALSQAHSESFPFPPNDAGDPDGPCSVCGSGQFWQLPGQPWHCRACEPDMPLRATTLTLPCHNERAQHASSLARLHTMQDTACLALSLAPDALCTELEAVGDLADVEGGTLTPKGLRLTAKIIAQESRRQEVLGLLQARPSLTHAVSIYPEFEQSYVILTIAVRTRATCELYVLQDKYDVALVKKLINHRAKGALMSKLNSTIERDIVVELNQTNVITRWLCTVCGGCTDKFNVLAEVLSGPHQGLLVCEQCLYAGDIDTRLARHADELEEWVKERVKKLRALIGRLQVPSYGEWLAYSDPIYIAHYAVGKMTGTDGDTRAEFDKVMHDDATYEVWRQRYEQQERESRIASEKNRQSSSLADDDIPF